MNSFGDGQWICKENCRCIWCRVSVAAMSFPLDGAGLSVIPATIGSAPCVSINMLALTAQGALSAVSAPLG